MSLFLLLKNCRIYTPYPIEGINDLLIINSKIAKISKSIKPKKDFKVINCNQKIVSPGFIDVHIQGAGGKDILEGTKEALSKISLTLAKTGVTGFLATTVVIPGERQKHLETVATAIKEGLPGSSILGIHLEGPFINVKKKGMIRKDCIRKPNIKFLHRLIKISKGNITLMTVAPELKGAVKIIRELKKFNIVPSLGHTLATYEESLKGINTGISHVTHLFNAMPPLLHREPGPIPAIIFEKNITSQVISDGVHIKPVVLNIIYKLLGKDKIVLITDGMCALGLGDGKYIYNNLEFEAKNGTCYYKDGTLIGTSLGLNQMAYRFMKFTNAPFEEVLQMITLNPAKTLNLKNKGFIAVGKDADIAIIDKNFNVYKTIIKGKVVWDS
jgi:N-acetylglucosamine-6-phosphate deacetylase